MGSSTNRQGGETTRRKGRRRPTTSPRPLSFIYAPRALIDVLDYGWDTEARTAGLAAFSQASGRGWDAPCVPARLHPRLPHRPSLRLVGRRVRVVRVREHEPCALLSGVQAGFSANVWELARVLGMLDARGAVH